MTRGPNWEQVRAKILVRDGRECQYCGDAENLHVHHIDPHDEFDNPASANIHLNLVTLCASCHKSLEYYGPREQEAKLWEESWRPKQQMQDADIDELPSDLTKTSVEIKLGTWQELNRRKRASGETFDDVIQRLLNEDE